MAGTAAQDIDALRRKIRLVDVGGAGGLQDGWLALGDRITPIIFEPNAAEAGKIGALVRDKCPDCVVLQTGLSNVVGPQMLHKASYWGCTSLREPNPDVLSRYRIAHAFNIVGTDSVNCTRYDVLFNAGLAPTPDVVKIDVQGYEYEVLQGFGGLLQTVIGIELETHVYPIYRGQRLMHDLIEMLADYGFVLRRLSPVPNFDGDIVEMDAFFTKNIKKWRELSEIDQEKFSTICQVWGLIDYRRIDPTREHSHLSD